MSYLRHVDGSSLTEGSISRQVASSFIDNFEGDIIHRDLAAVPVPHLTAAGITARLTDPAHRTPAEVEAAALQDELVDEFLGAQKYLFTIPMYNYSMPSVFKAWLDQIVIVGRTIALPEGSPVADRPALVISPRGGSYGPGTPYEGLDFLVPTLDFLLGPRTIGLEVTFITPELTLAPVVPQLAQFIEHHRASLANSHDQARQLAKEWSLTASGPSKASGTP
jgi:FMN-dependent NADH-azoreductase